jgi:putative protease
MREHAARPEVLAPAGDMDALRAAVDAGADAVYFGLSHFNARARAKNIDDEALEQALRHLHDHGVRGYVALNTLVFDDELAAIERAIRTCAEAGADALIVQDLGVLALCRRIAPDLPIHASTQMTCTDAASVELAGSLGASRVILARELSLGEIAQIASATTVELEVFVHGALCIAYSGQCLTSEAIGGRSANRGACAQACRLPYELIVDGAKRDLDERAYLLSPEDLAADRLVPELARIGVRSLKIEGRLKDAAYVAAVTRLYKQAVLAAPREPARREESRMLALQMFSRGSGPGFLEGVDHQRLVEGRSCDHRGLRAGTCRGTRTEEGRTYLVADLEGDVALGDGVLVEGGLAGAGELGGRVWSIRREAAGREIEKADQGARVLLWLGPDKQVQPVQPGRRIWKTSNPAAERGVVGALRSEPRRVGVAMRVVARLGDRPVIEARTEQGVVARVIADAVVELARTAPLGEAELRDKLGRLGGTPFVLEELVVSWPDRATLPISSLNRARRDLVRALLQAMHTTHRVNDFHVAELLAETAPEATAPPAPGLFVLCRTLEQAKAAIEAGADGIYLDFLELTGTGAALRELRAATSCTIGVAPPRIRKPGEDKIDRYLDSLEPDLLLVRSLGALRESAASARRWPARIGDFSLNVTNHVSAATVLRHGLSAFTPAFDLDAAQLTRLLAGPLAPFAEVVIHHPMPLFHMEHCVIAALLSQGKDHRTCGRPCDRHRVSLRDRAGMDHPVEADVACRNTVFHAAAQTAADLVAGLVRASVRRFRIELVRETAADVKRLVPSYRALVAGEASARELRERLRTASGYGVVRGSLRVLAE